MMEGTRLQLGDLSSLRTNHQEARQQPLPCLLKVRCLKERERQKEERDEKVKGPSATSVVSVNPGTGNWNSARETGGFSSRVLPKASRLEWCPFGGSFCFYRAFV
ncbi:hypothetical protein AVEN_202166-1 [Araneus ventricosus]|uniref:Uncharacterized protein n=1 Tax=Araneus ventricosus TaxID=182803 RepID=A0A4Y2LB11_ARAVE|nr:hypothetical protein AVEN_202166-1 [Araneus ventricosus]